MHVGMAVIFQNPEDERSDLQVYRDELALASLAEPLGFQSIWGVEHHFTDYTLCPAVLQFLTWCAAKTERIQIGSMVVVLPWHDPVRVVEQVLMLDNMSNGRLILGLGRGLGRVEFGGFRVPMEKSRGMFTEYADLILTALERGYVEYDGEHIQQPRRDIRPRPFKTFKGRTYAAAVSPESSRIMAELGVGILIIPQKPWEVIADDLRTYRQVFNEVNGTEAPAPVAAGWVFCDEDAGRAEELARKYIGDYWNTVIKHYELKGDHLAKTRGYESYGRLQELVNQEGGPAAMIDFFLGLQVWGTPEQCFDKIVDTEKRIGGNTFNAVFSYAGMPFEESERNLRLFAQKVMPELQRLEI